MVRITWTLPVDWFKQYFILYLIFVDWYIITSKALSIMQYRQKVIKSIPVEIAEDTLVCCTMVWLKARVIRCSTFAANKTECHNTSEILLTISLKTSYVAEFLRIKWEQILNKPHCLNSYLLLFTHHFHRVLWIVSHFVFWGLLQLSVWYGLWFIIAGPYRTCRSFMSTVIYWMAVSGTICHISYFYRNNSHQKHWFLTKQ